MAVPNNMHNLRHGHAAEGKVTPELKAWDAMWQRCTNSRNASFKHYGARGIAVCKRWKSFEKFFADMGHRPSPKHSLDRKKNWLGYSPKNCRWATPSEQQSNTRANRRVTAFGKTMLLTEWAREKGMSAQTLWKRLKTLSAEQALTMALRACSQSIPSLVKAAGYASPNDFCTKNKVSLRTLYAYQPDRVASLNPTAVARMEQLLGPITGPGTSGCTWPSGRSSS